MNFETTKKIVQGKFTNVEIVPFSKKFMASDNFKVQLKSSPSIEELKRKFLTENAADNIETTSAQSVSKDEENIGIIKIRSKDKGTDSNESSGERTIIVKNDDIMGAQG